MKILMKNVQKLEQRLSTKSKAQKTLHTTYSMQKNCMLHLPKCMTAARLPECTAALEAKLLNIAVKSQTAICTVAFSSFAMSG